MPIFEYQCKTCGARFEEIVLNNEAVCCPKCKSEDTAKLLSRVVFGGKATPTEFEKAVEFVAAHPDPDPVPSSSGGGCAGCSGGNCSTCGS